MQAQLASLMGAAPFFGTLNLRVASEERDALFSRRQQFAVMREPDSTACAGYLTEVNLTTTSGQTLKAWIILPELTAHADMLEVVSRHNLREHLDLHDGDKVTIQTSVS